jgi:hypothetical protein
MKPLAARAMRASLDGFEHRGTAQFRSTNQRSEENSIGASEESSTGIDSGRRPRLRSRQNRRIRSEAAHRLVEDFSEQDMGRFGQVGVDGGGGDVDVAEQDLHDPGVDAGFE